MDHRTPEAKIRAILAREPRYAEAAYAFVAEAVTFTIGELPKHRHVSARELLEGTRRYLVREYGPLAEMLLAEWGIRAASDVGRIVYLLIEESLLSASEEDSPEDFNIDFPLTEPLPEFPAELPEELPKIDRDAP